MQSSLYLLLQQFMTWKVPSRTLGMPLSQLLQDSQKTFQNDYLDDGKGGAKGLQLTPGACHHLQQVVTHLAVCWSMSAWMLLPRSVRESWLHAV